MKFQMSAFHRRPSGQLSTPEPKELSPRDTCAQVTACLVLVLSRGQGTTESRAQELDSRAGR